MATKNSGSFFDKAIEAAMIQNEPAMFTVKNEPSINIANLAKSSSLITSNMAVDALFNNREAVVNNPTTSITPPQFGVLGHIDPTRVFLLDAMQAITELRSQLNGEGNLAKKIDELLSEILTKNTDHQLGISAIHLENRWKTFDSSNVRLFDLNYEYAEDTYDTLYFKTGEENIPDSYKLDLNSHLSFILNSNHTVTLDAFAFGGTSAVNLARSDRLARQVEQYLVSQGVASSRIIKTAKGSPDNSVDKNDRVVILYPNNIKNTLKKVISRNNISNIHDLDRDIGKVASVYSTALFTTANNYKKEIKEVDGLHNQLMLIHKQLSAALAGKNKKLEKIKSEIPVMQRSLENLNQQRLKTLAEYKMVVSLVAEDWLRVSTEYSKRERILTNNSGLYFVRAQETPFTKPSPVDKSLRYGRIEDLVPATAISQDELPEEIEDYIETIVDIPIANWKQFNDSWNYLPSRNTIIKLMEQRKLRLTYLSQKTRKASSSKFVPMLQVHQSILQDYARFEFLQEASLQAFYRRAVEVISLEDLLTGTPHQLRGKAQAFRNQLDQATHALLAKLQNIKPGIRLEWATQAELDQLDLRNPYSWPGLKDEQQEDIGNVRSMIELVNWWWRQLNDNASSSSVTAVRNLLRAALMVSVGDDPKEMIHGYLQVIPSIFKAGDVLRAKLNRHAPIGTLLQLVNENNQLIGKLRIEDADENGSLVSITQILGNTSTTGMSQFSVIGIKTTGRSFV